MPLKTGSMKWRVGLLDIVQTGRIRASGIAFASHLQSDGIGLLKIIFNLIVRIGSISINLSVGRQIQGQRIETAHIIGFTGQKGKFHWNAIGGREPLYPNAIEVALLGRNVASVILASNQTGSRNPNVVAQGHRKGIEQVFRTGIDRFEHHTQTVEQV